MKNLKTTLYFLSLFLVFSVSGQRAPFSYPLEGEFTTPLSSIGDCNISSINFKYHLSTLSGEPVIYTNFKWKSGYGTDLDCLNDTSFELFIVVYINNLNKYFYIPAQGSFGLVPKGNNTWGANPLAGSPNWDRLFLEHKPEKAFDNYGDTAYVESYLAKQFWRQGELSVRSILIVQ